MSRLFGFKNKLSISGDYIAQTTIDANNQELFSKSIVSLLRLR
jgi:hypothetical protein